MYGSKVISNNNQETCTFHSDPRQSRDVSRNFKGGGGTLP